MESWTVDQDIHLASGQVEIDNIPPRITLAQTEGLITTSDSQVVLSGDIEDRNFDFYQVWYRRQGSERNWNPVAPSSPEIDFKERPREGVLARWFVLRDYRDSGIEVKVVAWDKAGNSSESTTRLAFDDDQDGMSNAEEIALGTDPRQFSRIEIQTDLKTLVTPYFFAGIEHPLHFYVTDVSDPDHPRPLPNAKLNISIDAGIYSQAGETVVWQSPDVDSQLVTVTCTLSRSDEIPVSGGKTENLLEARFNLLVMRDQDRDWMPDTREVSAPTSDSFSTYLNNSDSDGDGVMDGVDIAPRTTYQDNWNKTYYPGMLGKMLPLCFYGIGGEGSHTVRYYFVEDENGEKGTVYHELEREGIFESDVTNAGKMKTLANSHLFPGQTGELQPYFGLSTPSSNLPGRITIHQAGESGSQLDTPSWNSIKQQLSDGFDDLTDINIPPPGTEDKPSLLLTPPPGGQEKPQQPFAISSFEGDVNQLTAGGDEYLAMYEFMISKKGPEYIDFYYSSKIASGNAIVNNVEPIDVSTYLETGIHRGYLVVVAPGSNGYYDRTLTIQWRVNAEKDKTQLPTHPGGPSTKMGWLVEVFHPDNVFLPPNFLILQTSSTGDFPKLGPRLPWNKALFTEPILAQAQDEHLYYATVNIPGEHLKPGNALYIKLTPFWVKDEGGKVSFQPLETSPKYMKTLTLEPNRVVFAILRDPPYQPITVGGITVETVSPTQEWIPRRKTRPNHPLDPGTLEQLIAAIMASHPDWPMNLGSTDFFPLINGVSYTVRCFSTIGMEEQWKRGGLAPSLSQSIQQNSLDTVDVVCLLTPNRRDCSLLMQAIRWGS
ncbi:MAG: thrombospondin type 3 repeat-containing protein, partial [Atribacterota bacterium]